MAFKCSQCGECCSCLGLVHIIEQELGDYRFVVKNRYTNERTTVTVDPDKVGMFLDRSVFETLPDTCPFFRAGPIDGKGYCTVHLTRPEMCRDFGCWRVLVLDRDGRRVGRITGLCSVMIEDDALREFWETTVIPLGEPGGAAWDRSVVRLLREAGYQVFT